MTKLTTVNRAVTVTAVEFTRALEPLPRRIELDGISHSFIDRGIRTMVHHGERIKHIITMTDGADHYSLRRDGSVWTLISIATV